MLRIHYAKFSFSLFRCFLGLRVFFALVGIVFSACLFFFFHKKLSLDWLWLYVSRVFTRKVKRESALAQTLWQTRIHTWNINFWCANQFGEKGEKSRAKKNQQKNNGERTKRTRKSQKQKIFVRSVSVVHFFLLLLFLSSVVFVRF